MDCPVCYTSKAKHKLVCTHSFCYQCITHWYQECGNHTCPMCRQEICFQLNGDTREVHIQCSSNTSIDKYLKFHSLLDKYRGYNIKEIEYLRRQNWVEWVMEHRVNNQIYTKYIFYGIQGTKEACYKERQKEPKTTLLTKAYKD